MENQCHIIAEVTGSSPVSPTITTSTLHCEKHSLDLQFQPFISLHCR